jgi:hypothetical protein
VLRRHAALRSGPERIESGWWDGGDVVRDYYVVGTRAGVRLWIYRERRTRAARACALSRAGSCTACSADGVRRRCPAYAELHCVTNFSFLRGASHPEELVQRAHALGYAALAITDECSVSGVVRAHLAAKEVGLALIVGSELRLDDGLRSCCSRRIATATATWCGLLTRGRRAAPKGGYRLARRTSRNCRSSAASRCGCRAPAPAGFALPPTPSSTCAARCGSRSSIRPSCWRRRWIAERCTFSLDELRYEYPQEIVPDGHTPSSWLRELASGGRRDRYPGRAARARPRELIEHELALIAS